MQVTDSRLGQMVYCILYLYGQSYLMSFSKIWAFTFRDFTLASQKHYMLLLISSLLEFKLEISRSKGPNLTKSYLLALAIQVDHVAYLLAQYSICCLHDYG